MVKFSFTIARTMVNLTLAIYRLFPSFSFVETPVVASFALVTTFPALTPIIIATTVPFAPLSVADVVHTIIACSMGS